MVVKQLSFVKLDTSELFAFELVNVVHYVVFVRVVLCFVCLILESHFGISF